MGKYNPQIIKKITNLIEADSYTVTELCKAVQINEGTWYRWLAEKPEFSEAIKSSKEKFDQLIVAKAKRSLVKKIDGYSVDETKTTYVDSKNKVGESVPKIKEKTITKKHFQPDTTAIIFALTNKASDEYKHRQSVDSKVSITTKIDELTDDQLDLVIQQVLAQSHEKSQ